MDRRLVVAVAVVAVACLWVGRVTAQGGAYAGSGAVGVAAIESYSVDVDGRDVTVRGVVRNMSNAPLTNVMVSVWDNETVYARVGDLAPGQTAPFTVNVEGGPNWHWSVSITADVVTGVYGVAALPSAGR